MRKLLATIMLAVLPLVGCGDDPTGPDSSPVGTYQLATINASTLPYEFFGSEIMSGSLTLRSDNTFTTTTTSRSEDWDTGQMVTETNSESGTYSKSGGIIRFTSEEGTFEANFDGTQITINAGLIVMVYRR